MRATGGLNAVLARRRPLSASPDVVATREVNLDPEIGLDVAVVEGGGAPRPAR
jgi:hypothetical protein